MSVEMAMWRMTNTGPRKLEMTALDLESRLEDMLVEDPTMAGLDVLVIGRQIATTYGGYLDILAVDVDGHLHVLELKRDRTPRDVVAQTLDYGSWAQDLTLDDVTELYASNRHGADFADAYAEHFDQPVPDVFNADQQLTIVASELDPASDRIVEYLAERYAVPINAVFFRHFKDDDAEYLARTWLLDPAEAAAAKRRSRSTTKVRPWNGRDFYVVLGRVEYGGDRWQFARKYGLLAAGGGDWYWKPLRNLEPGHRVYAYVGGAGYVGVGRVTGVVQRAADVQVDVDGQPTKLVELPDAPDFILERAPLDDDDKTEFVVPVEWEEARDLDDAVSAPGLFASQVTVCKLRDERTIEVLEREFGS